MARRMNSDTDLRARFLAGMSHAAATVNVVTTDGPAGRAGVTVSAMSSVSADTPKPTLLVCVHRDSPAAAAILENGVFCVNVLSEAQSGISDAFAGRMRDRIADKFECAEWQVMPSGAPRVVDPLVAFDCRVVSFDLVGTHHVFFGEAGDIFIAGEGSPLLYAKRDYAGAARLGERTMSHTRIRPFNTRDTYPEQKLDNDLAQAVVARGRTVWLRGQCPQELDGGANVGVGDPEAQAHKVMQNIRQLLAESGAEMSHLVKLVVYLTDIRHRETIYRVMGEYIQGVHPVCTGLVVVALARPEWLVEIDATAVIPD